MPAASAAIGTRLVVVSPGPVFTSRIWQTPSVRGVGRRQAAVGHRRVELGGRAEVGRTVGVAG